MAIEMPVHQALVAQKIIELNYALLINKNNDDVIGSLLELGPLCFWDEMDNEEQSEGAKKLMDWIIKGLRKDAETTR